MFPEGDEVMKVMLDQEAREYLQDHHYGQVRVDVERACVDGTCSDSYRHADIHYGAPKEANQNRYERIEMEELTLWMDKELQDMEEVHLTLEHNLLRNELHLEGFEDSLRVTHHKF